MSDEAGVRLRTARGRWVLTAAVLGSAIAFIDAVVVGIAQPTIGREFHVDVAALQWVTIGYMLTLSGLLLLGGALGDRVGRRRVFLIGIVWFAVASLLCAVAPNVVVLIIARAVQGIGGALLTPGSLAILEATYVPDDRSSAIGAWSGLGGIAGAVAPFLGGYLIAAVSWRLIFLINLPIAAAVVILTLRHVPESRDTEETGRLDFAGTALIVIALVGLSYALVEGPAIGFGVGAVLVSLLGGVVAFVLFVVTESRVREPVVPLSLFSSRQFSVTNVVTLLIYGVLGVMLFLLPIQLQQVSHYSPLAAGAALLPVTAIMLLLSARSGRIASRIGPRLQMSVGPIVVAIGVFLYSRIDASGNYLTEVLPAVMAFGLGLAITVAPLTSTAMSSAPARRAGLASAINNTVARTGSLLAVAVVPPIVGIAGDAYLHPAVFEAGFRSAVFIGALVCAAGGVIAAAGIRNARRATPVVERRPDYHCALDAPPLRDEDEQPVVSTAS
ncbi:MAG: DHA2 family efflux MFS transporter permease subunit [Candidatus Dormibacteraeota bacterium]|nr:DHA2 family efflux MFS transporter permease subunit [Candidatus Dormibacteraeota bacterium]